MSGGQVIVLTGASSGIGAALVQRLGKEAKGSIKLAMLARRKEVLAEVANNHFHQADAEICKLIPCDVTDRAQVQAAADAVLGDWGKIDVWINNAGRGLVAKVGSELTVQDCNDMMQVNTYSALHGMQIVLPSMRARVEEEAAKKNKENGSEDDDKLNIGVVGQIININSVLGKNAGLVPMRSAYSGAKYFLNALTDSLESELKADYEAKFTPIPIALTTVSPGMVATEFGLNAGGADTRENAGAQPVEEVAEIIFTAIQEKKTDDYYTRAEHKAWCDNLVLRKGKDQNCPFTAEKK